MTDEELYALSDEALEEKFREAKAELESPETDYEESTEEVDTTEDFEIPDGEDEEIDLEQPENDQDSDHDASTEELEDDSTEEETETDAESDLDEEAGAEDEETAEVDEDEGDDVQPTENYTFKANGKEYTFSDEEIKDQFPRIFGQAMDYTKKMQTIKPWRKTIDAIEQAKLNHDDINLAIDVLKGDKDAIAEVIKRTGVDALDLNADESNYVAKDYGRDDTTLAIQDIVDVISKDPEYATTHSILSKEWDDRSWETMTKDPEKIKLLHIDVKNGMYNKIQPLAEKLKVYDGGKQSDLEYYVEAAKGYFTNLRQQEALQAQQERIKRENQIKLEEQRAAKDRLVGVKAKSESRAATKQASVKRKAAAPSSSALNKSTVVDYLDASDEAFDDWYTRLENEM